MMEKMEKTENRQIFMNEEEKQTWFDRYNAGVHRQGRIWLLGNLILLLLVPFALGMILLTLSFLVNVAISLLQRRLSR